MLASPVKILAAFSRLSFDTAIGFPLTVEKNELLEAVGFELLPASPVETVGMTVRGALNPFPPCGNDDFPGTFVSGRGASASDMNEDASARLAFDRDNFRPDADVNKEIGTSTFLPDGGEDGSRPETF